MYKLKAFGFGFLVMALFVIDNVNARLPPPETHRSSEYSTPNTPKLFNSDPSFFTSDQEDTSRRFLEEMKQSFELLHYFRHLLHQDPNQSFWPFMSPWPQMKPMFPILDSSKEDMDDSFEFLNKFRPDPLSKGYKLINETSFVINGRKICQSTYEKVENKPYGVFSSRMITAKPCGHDSKEDQEESSTNLPNITENERDSNSTKPSVEREEKPIAAETVNNESNKPPITVNENQEAPATTLPIDDKIKSNGTTVENEIIEKSPEQPTITVNDGK